MLSFKSIKERTLTSKFLKDSLWSVFGSGMGYGMMLLAGIVIARFLGKDLYGEYGFVKTTMFQFAAFATLGLGYTSTKFVAEYKKKDATQTAPIINASINITLITSCIVASAILVFANPLAKFLKEPTMTLALRALAIVVILKALSTTQFGILAGLGRFKDIAKINAASGFALLIACIPLTYIFSLNGSLISLVLSQALCLILNFIAIRKSCRCVFSAKKNKNYVWTITRFSLPVAMQELTFALSQWLGILIIGRFGTFGEIGLYTASDMWNSVILIIPSMLSNVIISHLSSNTDNIEKQKRNVNMMLLVNLACTIIPFALVTVASPLIIAMYGHTFADMQPVLRIITCSSIFICCSNVLSAELLSQGATWTLFAIRSTRDFLIVTIGYVLITLHNGINAAQNYATSSLICAALFLFLLFVYYKFFLIKKANNIRICDNQ